MNTTEPSGSRPLNSEEAHLLRWMLSNGGKEAARYLDAIKSLQVSSWRCPCGCASLEFVTCDRDPARGMRMIADFMFENGDQVCGICVYLIGDGELGGVEVTGYSGEAPTVLPKPEQLRPCKAE